MIKVYICCLVLIIGSVEVGLDIDMKFHQEVMEIVSYDKRVYMLLGTKEKSVTRVMLEFLCNVIPLFKQFLILHQKSLPVVHMLYDSMCDILAKLMRRFMKTQVFERKYGLDLAGIQCRDLKAQLADRDTVIGDNTRKALRKLLPDQQTNVPGICSFFSTTVSYLPREAAIE